MRRILVFTTNWLGDALFISPLLSTLKNNLPKSHISVLCVPRVKEVFQNNPNVDKIIMYNERKKPKHLFSRLEFIFRLNKERFDTAFIIKPSLSRTLVMRFAGIKQVIGFDNPKSGWLLTVRVPPPDKVLHKIDYFLTLPENLGFNINQRKYEFFPSEEDKTYIFRLLSKKGIVQNLPLVLINPGANWYPKRWATDNFAALIKEIKEALPVNIAITGAQKDKDIAKRIIIESGKEVYDFTGQTTLGQLGALMQEANIVISADSGPMHIAAAVGAKVVALFGPTSASITGPYPLENHIVIHKDVGCGIPCYDKGCRDYRCMRTIRVQDVAQIVIDLLRPEKAVS